MKRKVTNCLLSILVSTCVLACKNDQLEDVQLNYSPESNYPEYLREDSFENDFAGFWRFQKAAPERIAISADPTNPNNQVLRVELHPDERTHGGNRTELVIAGHDSLGYRSTYGFKFMLPDSFFKAEDSNIWFLIHQWHDEPQAGYNWKTNKHKTKPPASLIVQYTKDQGYQLVYVTGLQTGDLKEAKILRSPIQLEPNLWYEFANEILWSVYDIDGYSKPSINGEVFLKDEEPTVYARGRNMYNAEGSYFKFGLYSSGQQKNSRTLYFDDFYIRSKRVGYAPIKLD